MRLCAVQVLLLAGFSALFACSGENSRETPLGGNSEIDAGRSAPAFSLPDLSGQIVSLSDFKGQTVVIDFWATWCPPCVFQVPILNEIQQTYRDRSVVVLGISVDTEGREVVQAFAAEHGVEYRILLGDEALAREYGAPGFPTLVIVHPDGSLDPGPPHVGLVEQEDLERQLAQIPSAT